MNATIVSNSPTSRIIKRRMRGLLYALIILLSTSIITIGCANRQLIYYHFTTPTRGACVDNSEEKIIKTECGLLSANRRLVVSHTGSSYQLFAVIYDSSALHEVIDLIYGERSSSRRLDVALSGLTPVYIRVHNFGNHSISFNPLDLEFVSTDLETTGKRIRAISPEDYRKNYKGYTLGMLPYFFAFIQSSSYEFFTKIPPWFNHYYGDDTSSIEERENRDRRWLAITRAKHEKYSHLKPGDETRVMLLFPEIEPGSYRLALNDSIKKNSLLFPDIKFTYVKEYLQRGKTPKDKVINKRIIHLLKNEWKHAFAERNESLTMHKQLRDHFRLKKNRNNNNQNNDDEYSEESQESQLP